MEEQEFFRPKLNLALKLEVAQAPLIDRGNVLLVAEVLEEMLTFIEEKEGQVIPVDQHLPPRPRKAPGKTANEAKKQREEELKKEAEMRAKEDERRKKRKEELKKELGKLKEKKTNDE